MLLQLTAMAVQSVTICLMRLDIKFAEASQTNVTRPCVSPLRGQRLFLQQV